jgi:N-dimethylarginine dimethylaminohydrolase
MNMGNAPRFLMCPPRHFGVTYAINPWMDPESWSRLQDSLLDTSQREWTALHGILSEHAIIELVEPAAGLPDLVFTANAAVVLDRKVLLARFRYPERAGEEMHFEGAFRALQARGLIEAVVKMPEGLVLEGAGDCVWDGTRNMFWTGFGPRSDRDAATLIEQSFGVESIPLGLADPRFYHLDTAFCPLPGGEVLLVPAAFTSEAAARIRERLAPVERIEVGIEDARMLAANAVAIGDVLVMSACVKRLDDELAERGYRVVTTPLTSFLRSGGAAFCLTLRLELKSKTAVAAHRAA